MSHKHEGDIICPNCNSAFDGGYNYCPKCGQPTHLHKDTFWGLIGHFVAHYFHIESKFLQTFKALWFSPGKLTIAYFNKQRMRYLPPVSLYIFVSAVYFLLFFSLGGEVVGADKSSTNPVDSQKVSKIYYQKKLYGDNFNFKYKDKNSAFSKFLAKQGDIIQKKYGDTSTFISEKANHNIPKIFFLMIPVMALLLKLLFLRRRDMYFVDHAIFSLHYHSFWFSLFLVKYLLPQGSIYSLVLVLLFAISAIYMVAAIRNVYKVSWLKSVSCTVVIAVGYIIFLLLAFLLLMFLILCLA